MNIRTVLCALSLVVGVTSSGGTYEFQNKSKAVHYWDNPKEWKMSSMSDVVPQVGNQVQMDAFGADSTMFLTNDLSVSFTQIRMKGGIRATSAVPTGSFRFLGEDVEFSLPAAGKDYDLCPAKFQTYNCGVACDLVVLSNAVSRKAAQLSMSNFDLLSGNREDGSSYFQFNAGSFNFHDPDGTDNGSMLIFGSPACGTAEIDFAPGTVLRAGDGILQSPSGTAVDLGFNQAEAVFAGKFTVKGGALSIRGGSFSSESYSQSDGDSIVGDDAQFTVATSAGSTISGGIFMITNEAVASVAGDMAVNGVSNPRLEVAGGDFTVKGKLDLGSDNNGTLAISGGKFTLTANGDSLRVGAGGGSGLIEISGGTTTVARIRLARSTGDGSTRLVQTGGLLRSHFGNYGGIEFLQSCKAIRGGTHVVELNGGVSELRFIKCSVDLAYGTRCLYADGGTLRPTENSTTGFITGLTAARIGEKGLTLDTAGYDVNIDQDVANKDGVDGFMRKTGAGEAVFSRSYAVAQTFVEGGTLRAGDANFQTALAVCKGAKFSLVGSADSVSLTSLAVTNAVLALDPGDVIQVDGPVSCCRLRVEWSSLPSSATEFLQVSGRLTDEAKVEIANAMFSNPVQEGRHAEFTFSYDEESGMTKVSAAVAPDVPLSEEKTWTGTGSWDNEANWSPSGSLPTQTQKVVFESGTAGKTVSVDSSAEAGALSFAGDGYGLSGEGPLNLLAPQGAAAIDVAEGAHRIDVPLNLAAAVPVSVGGGAVLEVSKTVNHGGLAKSGTGKLVLSAPGNYEKGVSSSDGMLSVRHSEAFGADPTDKVTLSGGSLEFNDANGAEMRLAQEFQVETPEKDGIVIFKTDSDAVVGPVEVDNGAFAKRGAGKLTIEVPSARSVTLARDAGNFTAIQSALQPGGLVFPEDGTAPTCESSYPSFSVAEGELELKGTGPDARVIMVGKTAAIVGIYAHECVKQPVLTINGVELDASANQKKFYIGTYLGDVDNGVGVSNVTVRIVNGGSLYIYNSKIGYCCTFPGARVCIAATNGLFRIGDGNTYLTAAHGDDCEKTVYAFKDSKLHVDGGKLMLSGGIDLDFDNSVLSGTSGQRLDISNELDRVQGTLRFRNGATYAGGAVQESITMRRNLDVVFDGAEWVCGDNRGNGTIDASRTGHVHYQLQGDGVVFAPAADKVYEINAQLVGEGGVVKRGAGTVRFGPASVSFTGTLAVEDGQVDLLGAGALIGPCIKGAGAFVGLSATNLRIKTEFDDDWTNVGDQPTLSDCTLQGRVFVDAGRTSQNPLRMAELSAPIAIAHISGSTAVDVSRWRLVNTGDHAVRGAFSVSGNTVYMVPAPPQGAILIVR